MNTGTSTTNIDVGDGTIGRRVIAYLIDIFIISMIGVAAWFVGLMTFGLLLFIIIPLLTILPFAYHSLMIAANNQATFGQSIMGLKVVSQNGEKVEILQAIILTALFYASLTFTGGIILIWCLFDDKQRCLHDILAGTLMVRAD